MPKAIIYTQAYNAEKTLPYTIRSVLNQSHEDWIWFIIDNGSHDDTAEIIAEVAKNDCRVIPYALHENKIDIYLLAYSVIAKNYDNCYFTQIDADDEFKPDFLKLLIEFMEIDDLDIACCGTLFAQFKIDEGLQVTGQRKTDKKMIIEGKDFADKFTEYKTYTNELWGKVFKLQAINPEDLLLATKFHYDSQVVFKFFRRAERVGILSEALYYNIRHKNSLSSTIYQQNNLNKLLGDVGKKLSNKTNVLSEINETFVAYQDYLLTYGEISEENADYLYAIYIDWIHSYLIKWYLTQMNGQSIAVVKELLRLIKTEVFINAFQHKSLDKYAILSNRGNILAQMRHYFNICKVCLSELASIDELSDEIKILQEELP